MLASLALGRISQSARLTLSLPRTRAMDASKHSNGGARGRWISSLELGLWFEVSAMLGGPDQARRRPHDAEGLRRHLLSSRAGRCQTSVEGAPGVDRGRANGTRNGNGKPPKLAESTGPRIPVERLRPIIERRYDGVAEVAIEDLAHRSGLPVRTVKDVVRERVIDVDFGTADALISAASATFAWRTELADLYELDAAV